LGDDQTVGGGAPLTLGHALEALDAQQLGRLGLVAIGLVERLLHVEHARAGGLAQCLDVSGGVVRHVCAVLLRRDGPVGWTQASGVSSAGVAGAVSGEVAVSSEAADSAGVSDSAGAGVAGKIGRAAGRERAR